MIGIFDSGLGGLVIFRELVKQLPEYSYIYLGDNARTPYGPRTPDEIYKFTLQAIEKLFAEGCELVILACNTASANALRRIQQNDLVRHPGKKVLGILVPTIEQITGLPWSALHPYPQAMHIGVFATQATVNSHAYKKEILHRNPKAEVVEIACPELTTMIEAGADEPALRAYVAQCVEQLKHELAEPDAVLLGCTHYPLVLEHFAEALPDVPIFDQGQITADALRAFLLRHLDLKQKLDTNSSRRFLTTGDPDGIQDLASAFYGQQIIYEYVDLENLRVPLSIPYLNTKLVGDVMGDNPRVLFLHGGGGSTRHRFGPIRKHLLEVGLGSVAFDHIGHGDTGGEISSSSLRDRTDQALAVIEGLKLQDPFTLIGTSMGGYTAIKLSELIPVQTLVLGVPAAYTPAAYDAHFGAPFASLIRVPDSWQASDAWEILARFKGNLLIIYGALDAKIPPAVIQKMYDCAVNTKHRELLILPNSDHGIMRHVATHPDDLEFVLRALDGVMGVQTDDRSVLS